MFANAHDYRLLSGKCFFNNDTLHMENLLNANEAAMIASIEERFGLFMKLWLLGPLGSFGQSFFFCGSCFNIFGLLGNQGIL